MIQPDTVYERVQYTFEDDLYDTVPDLITFYVGSGKPISAASGARIQIPRNRMYPLSFYAVKYPVGVSGGTPTPSSGGSSRIVSPVGAPSPPFRYIVTVEVRNGFMYSTTVITGTAHPIDRLAVPPDWGKMRHHVFRLKNNDRRA